MIRDLLKCAVALTIALPSVVAANGVDSRPMPTFEEIEAALVGRDAGKMDELITTIIRTGGEEMTREQLFAEIEGCSYVSGEAAGFRFSCPGQRIEPCTSFDKIIYAIPDRGRMNLQLYNGGVRIERSDCRATLPPPPSSRLN